MGVMSRKSPSRSPDPIAQEVAEQQAKLDKKLWEARLAVAGASRGSVKTTKQSPQAPENSPAKRKAARKRLHQLQAEREAREAAAKAVAEQQRLQAIADDLRAREKIANAANKNKARHRQLQLERDERNRAHAEARHRSAQKLLAAEKAARQARTLQVKALRETNMKHYSRLTKQRARNAANSGVIADGVLLDSTRSLNSSIVGNSADENNDGGVETDAMENLDSTMTFGKIPYNDLAERDTQIATKRDQLRQQVEEARRRREQAESECNELISTVKADAEESALAAEHYRREETAKLERLKEEAPLATAAELKIEHHEHKEELLEFVEARLEQIKKETWDEEINPILEQQDREIQSFKSSTQARRLYELGEFRKKKRLPMVPGNGSPRRKFQSKTTYSTLTSPLSQAVSQPTMNGQSEVERELAEQAALQAEMERLEELVSQRSQQEEDMILLQQKSEALGSETKHHITSISKTSPAQQLAKINTLPSKDPSIPNVQPTVEVDVVKLDALSAVEQARQRRAMKKKK